MKRVRAAGVVGALSAVLASGCTEGLRGVASAPSPATISCDARAKIDRLAAASTRRKQNVRLELSAPFMPSAIQARGAVAMDPAAGDLRMILLGPGGATAIDLWMHGDAYRFVVPALDRTLRGNGATPPSERRGLPVDFLGWWMLHPLRGELLFAEETALGVAFVLRDVQPGAVAYVDARIGADGALDATRTTWSGDVRIDEERVHATSLGCGRVEYTQASTSLRVVAECESESGDVPARAFVDPEASAAAPGGPPK